ncbi:MAG: hypothetical protein M1322_03240 [Candidatus Parvarchaeota archaeon]|nr:hypothetical protein [Candidatus Parvarchaeota archaeon]
MKAAARRSAYTLSFFVLFLIFIGFVLFLVLFESGIIILNAQSVSISSFSCSPSGTVINVYKSVQQPVNITGIVLTVGGVPYSFLTDGLQMNGGAGYYSFSVQYRCILNDEAVNAKIYYQTYSSASQSLNGGNDFFSKLISNTQS